MLTKFDRRDFHRDLKSNAVSYEISKANNLEKFIKFPDALLDSRIIIFKLNVVISGDVNSETKPIQGHWRW
jgi:hypothetical protein